MKVITKEIVRDRGWNKKKILKIPSDERFEEIAQCAFWYCDGLKTVSIPEGITRINDYAFFCCQNLEEVELPTTLTYIGKHCFEECLDLKKITIPKNVEEIDATALHRCIGLEEITVDKNNTGYRSEDGVLYRRIDPNLYELVAFPEAKEIEVFNVPKNIKSIGSQAFYENKFLKKIIIPDGVESLGYGAFACMRDLEYLFIPYSVENIGSSLITCSDNLKRIVCRRDGIAQELKRLVKSNISSRPNGTNGEKTKVIYEIKIYADGFIDEFNDDSHNHNIAYDINESSKDRHVLRYLEAQGIETYEDKMNLIGRLKLHIPNIRTKQSKFLLGALRIYFENNKLKNIIDRKDLDFVLKYIRICNDVEKYDENLNGKSLEELTTYYKNIAEELFIRDLERSSSKDYENKNNSDLYRIVPIDSFDKAKKYAKYTQWCITKDKDSFDIYREGGRRFYFCLKDGFENVPEIVGENAPLDEYGLSMIAVSVESNGELYSATTRWNDDFDGENDISIDTTEQLEDILGINYYNTFKL